LEKTTLPAYVPGPCGPETTGKTGGAATTQGIGQKFLRDQAATGGNVGSEALDRELIKGFRDSGLDNAGNAEARREFDKVTYAGKNAVHNAETEIKKAESKIK
jgi:hypothetical protein